MPLTTINPFSVARLTPAEVNALLRRPGAGACNQVSGTASEQLSRAMLGRAELWRRGRAQRLASLVRDCESELRPLLADLLASDIGDMIAGVLSGLAGAGVPE